MRKTVIEYIYKMKKEGNYIMKEWLAVLGIVVCILIVGYVEDPCSTEGLPQGCMEKVNQ